jgi:hypothetical protein
MNKAVSWIVILLGAYQILSILIEAIPVVLEGPLGWIIGIVLVIVGILLLRAN